MIYSPCKICPRECGVDRAAAVGLCGCGSLPVVAKTMLHKWEEPCISGDKGSGAIFFAGCSLHCSFCQNKAISRIPCAGKIYNAEELAELMLGLEREGAHNINLVTAAHFAPTVADALKVYKARGSLPVVYNTSAYEKADVIRSLSGLVDVYLPDLKYFGGGIAEKFSSAENYNRVAAEAIDEMVKQQPEVVMHGGLIKRGVIIRHLVLPGYRLDSEDVLRQIGARWGTSAAVSLMRQYTPEFAADGAPARRVTSYEYNSLLKVCAELGLRGYYQTEDSASDKFTPDFDIIRGQ